MKRTKDNSGQETVPPDGRSPDEQPRWRKDFPIDWPQDDYVSRRELVKFGVLTSLAFTVGQFWVVVKSWFRDEEVPAAQAIAELDELAVGETKIFEYPEGSTPRLLVRLDETTYVAYDQQCTHLLCPVLPELDEGKLHCPCHNGWFDAASGRPTAGPPRRPLPRVLLEFRDAQIYATGVERRV
jgi:Rieske Fe-S protein